MIWGGEFNLIFETTSRTLVSWDFNLLTAPQQVRKTQHVLHATVPCAQVQGPGAQLLGPNSGLEANLPSQASSVLALDPEPRPPVFPNQTNS